MPLPLRPLGILAAVAALLLSPDEADAQRIMVETISGDEPGLTVPVLEFDHIALSPDGSTIVATGLLDVTEEEDGEFLYAFPIPTDPSTDTVTALQITPIDFTTGDSERIFRSPAISADGQAVFFAQTRDGAEDGTGVNSLHTAAINGSNVFDTTFNGFFSGPSSDTTSADNLVNGTTSNTDVLLTPNGQNLLFLGAGAGPGGEAALFVTPSNGGGTINNATQLSAATDDLANGFFDATDSLVAYSAPGGRVLTTPVSGGTVTEVNIAASPNADGFEIDQRLVLSSDGQTVFFIGDYLVDGQEELFSVPIGGGTPTRINDALVDGGDVLNFELSPDGSTIVYAADEEFDNLTELFSIAADGTGGSARISQAPANAASFDVDAEAGPGSIVFTPDSGGVFYLGDLVTNGVDEIFFSDLTEQSTPTFSVDTTVTYSGADGGDFFDEALWQDGDGNAAVADTINPSNDGGGDGFDGGDDIEIDLVIDGATATAGGDIDIGDGGSGSLTLVNGATLNITDGADDLDIDGDASISVSDSTVNVGDNFFSDGPVNISNSTFNIGDDIEFRAAAETTITNTDIDAADFFEVQGATVTITDSTLDAGDDIEIENGSDVTLTNTVVSGADFIQFLGGSTTTLNQGSVTATGAGIIQFDDESTVTINGTDFSSGASDIEFQSGSVFTISGGSFATTDAANSIEFQGFEAGNSIEGATFTTSNLSVENTDTPTAVVATDSTFTVTGDINDLNNADAGSLTLFGDSSLTANNLQEGFDLFLDDNSIATIGALVDGTSTPTDFLGGVGLDGAGASVTLLDPDAVLTVVSLDTLAGGAEPEAFIFNGVTGDSLLSDPSVFTLNPIAGGIEIAIVGVGILTGDFNGDGVVDAADYTVWRDNLGGDEAALNGNSNGDGVVNAQDYLDWVANFGQGTPPGQLLTASTTVPEPGSTLLVLIAASTSTVRRRRGPRRRG